MNLYPLINHLKAQLPMNQWHFLLTAYEIGKSQWIERSAVVRAAQLPDHASNVSELTSRLRTQGYLEIENRPNGINQGTIHIRLTRPARDLLRDAFTRAQGHTSPIPA